MGKIRVIIADDHPVVRKGTCQLLQQELDLEVVGEAANGEEAVRLATSLKPDVAIIDIAMPGVDGIEATKQIKALCPSVAILILTAYDDDQLVFALLDAGAAGYLLKSVEGCEIINAVRALHAGESVLHPAIARKVLNRFIRSPGKQGKTEPAEVLSERELEVLRLASRGLSDQEIASELYLSLHTVKAHMGHIFDKLNVGSRTEAVVRALKQGWITLDDVPEDYHVEDA